MKDLIDFLGIYRARTLPKAPKQDGKAYHYAPSTKALASPSDDPGWSESSGVLCAGNRAPTHVRIKSRFNKKLTP